MTTPTETIERIPPVGRVSAELEARSISAWFGSAKVLDRVSLTMPAKTVTALIGPSGCGKSTFLRILNRMHESVPSAKLAGEVLLNGQDIYSAGLRVTETRRRIGMVFQKPNPFPAMTIADNVTAGLKLTGMKVSRSARADLVERCLTRGGLWNEVKDRLNMPGSALSGGQQQRLCIARSLAVDPDILLMDEPCSALDPTSTRRVEETIAELAPDVTIVIVTHNMQQAARVSQQCAFFLAAQGTPGQIVEYGPTEEIFSSPNDPRTEDYVNGRFGVTLSILDDPGGGPPTVVHPALDRPRRIDPSLPPSDHVFRHIARAIGVFVLVLTGSIGLFLGYQAVPTLKRYGLSFFTEADWQPELDHVGISAVLVGTVEVALIALAVGFPLALLTALYISEFAPTRLKSSFVAAIDLMAAVPSIIYGLWGFFLLQPHAIYLARWLSQHFGWIPIFKVDTDPNAASWAQSQYTASAFIAGLCVAMMVIPLSCAVMRGVFALAPIGEREAAYALGATRWGMIRTVVLPFGRGGIIGGTMLGLGRALGETIAVLLIISPAYEIKFHVLTAGTQTTSALIAGRFGEATSAQLAALLTAGFVLFVITLGVNTTAAIVVSRSRSGTATEI